MDSVAAVRAAVEVEAAERSMIETSSAVVVVAAVAATMAAAAAAATATAVQAGQFFFPLPR